MFILLHCTLQIFFGANVVQPRFLPLPSLNQSTESNKKDQKVCFSHTLEKTNFDVPAWIIPHHTKMLIKPLFYNLTDVSDALFIHFML